MGDRAPMLVHVWAVRPKKVEAVKTIMVEHGLGLEWANDPKVEDLTTVNFEDFTDPEASLGLPHDVAKDLEELGVCFYIEQDAKYEYDAEIIYFIPGVGRWDGTGGGSGSDMVECYRIDQLIDRYAKVKINGPHVFEFLRELNELTGRSWRKMYANARERHDKAEKAKVDSTNG